MRILIWGQSPVSPQSGYWFWLKSGLETAGHQVIALDMFGLASLYGPAGMQRIILTYARAYAVDVAIVVTGSFVEPPLLQALRQAGIVLISMRYDDGLIAAPGMTRPAMATLRRFTSLDGDCDLAVTICSRAATLFAEMGVPAPVYLPLAYPWELVPNEQLALAPVIRYFGSARHVPGQPESWRIAIVRALLAAGLPLELHHASWASVPGCEAAARPTPDLPAFLRGMATATVNLCLAAERLPEPVPMMRLLHMEIAAAGAMQVTYPCAELAHYFVPGVDFAAAITPEDYVRQCRYFLGHPEAARHMGQNSRRALERQGSWTIWWEQVVGLLADKGIRLDPDSTPRPPAADQVPVLAMVATSLAHLHEAAGQPDVAQTYFEEVLGYDPADYAGLAGLARLAANAEAAGPLWLTAMDAAPDTHGVCLPAAFNTRTFQTGTDFALDAGIQALASLAASGRWEAILQVAARLAPDREGVGMQIAQTLVQAQQWDTARRCLNLVLAHWPEDGDAWRLRARVHSELGWVLEARRDTKQAEAIEQRPLERL